MGLTVIENTSKKLTQKEKIDKFRKCFDELEGFLSVARKMDGDPILEAENVKEFLFQISGKLNELGDIFQKEYELPLQGIEPKEPV